MIKHTLPDGGWATIRDSHEVSVRDRNAVRHLMAAIGAPTMRALAGVETPEDYEALGLTLEQLDLIQSTQEATVVAVLAGWSYDEPLPTLATVGDLPASRYDYLVQAAAGTGAQIGLNVNTDPTMEPDPKALSGS